MRETPKASNPKLLYENIVMAELIALGIGKIWNIKKMYMCVYVNLYK